MVLGWSHAGRKTVFFIPYLFIVLMCAAGIVHIFFTMLFYYSSDISFATEDIKKNEEEVKVIEPLPLLFHGLTPELRKYAEETIGETAEIKAKALYNFRMLIKDKKDIFSRDDDIFLLAFLRYQNFDVPRAFKVFNNFFEMRSKYKGLYTGRLPSELWKVIDMKALVVSPHRFPPGSQVTLIKIGNLDLEKSTADDFTAAVAVVGELILEYEASQVCGYITIIDCRNITFQHYIQFLSTSYISLVITLLQECWPQKMRGLHFCYEPTVLHVLYKIFLPILTPEFRDSVHFHGDNLTSLYQHIPPDYLPEDLGGNTGPFNTTKFLSYFLSQEYFIRMNNAYGLVEN